METVTGEASHGNYQDGIAAQHTLAAGMHPTSTDAGGILAASDSQYWCGLQLHVHTFLAYTPNSLLRPCFAPSTLAGCPAGTSLTCMSMSCMSQIIGVFQSGFSLEEPCLAAAIAST